MPAFAGMTKRERSDCCAIFLRFSFVIPGRAKDEPGISGFLDVQLHIGE
jgi:hypothetical protein